MATMLATSLSLSREVDLAIHSGRSSWDSVWIFETKFS